jgi:hypothetical protein
MRKASLENSKNIIMPTNQDITFKERLNIPLDSGYSSNNFIILLKNLVRKIITMVDSKIPEIINNDG